jgi:zinc transporter, ZIP family
MIIEKESREQTRGKPRLPTWVTLSAPLLALALLVLVFTLTNPLALFTANLPPVEALSFERIRVVPEGFQVTLINSGPQAVTVAQVQVDDAYWQFSAQPSAAIPRFGRTTLTIPYPWVETEPHVVRVVTSTGLTFEDALAVTTLTPTPGRKEFLAYGLLGIYVGVIPVGLGLLWFPTLRRMGRRWLGFLLALTVGLLVFLLIDTFFEVLEVGAELPGMFQGIPLALFAALLTWLAIVALGSRQKKGRQAEQSPAAPRSGLYIARLVALSIGLHNFGEGLAVGAAFALGEAALGSFLVIGFILHNITEGIGIAAPLVPSRKANEGAAAQAEEQASQPNFKTFTGLALLAGFPAVLGAWIGGFAFSPLLGVLFLGIGMGAIWQVIVEVSALLRRYAERDGLAWISGLNLGGFLIGITIMYFTAFLVKF